MQTEPKHSDLLATLSQLLKLYHKYLLYSLRPDLAADRKAGLVENIRDRARTLMDRHRGERGDLTGSESGVVENGKGDRAEVVDRLMNRFIARLREKARSYAEQYSQDLIPSLLSESMAAMDRYAGGIDLGDLVRGLFGLRSHEQRETRREKKLSGSSGNNTQILQKKANATYSTIEPSDRIQRTTIFHSFTKKSTEIQHNIDLISIIDLDEKDLRRRYFAASQSILARPEHPTDKSRKNSLQQPETTYRFIVVNGQRIALSLPAVGEGNGMYQEMMESNRGIGQMMRLYEQGYRRWRGREEGRVRKVKEGVLPAVTGEERKDKEQHWNKLNRSSLQSQIQEKAQITTNKQFPCFKPLPVKPPNPQKTTLSHKQHNKSSLPQLKSMHKQQIARMKSELQIEVPTQTHSTAKPYQIRSSYLSTQAGASLLRKRDKMVAVGKVPLKSYIEMSKMYPGTNGLAAETRNKSVSSNIKKDIQVLINEEHCPQNTAAAEQNVDPREFNDYFPQTNVSGHRNLGNRMHAMKSRQRLQNTGKKSQMGREQSLIAQDLGLEVGWQPVTSAQNQLINVINYTYHRSHVINSLQTLNSSITGNSRKNALPLTQVSDKRAKIEAIYGKIRPSHIGVLKSFHSPTKTEPEPPQLLMACRSYHTNIKQ